MSWMLGIAEKYTKDTKGAIKIEIKQKVETACKIAEITVTELGARMGMSQQNYLCLYSLHLLETHNRL